MKIEELEFCERGVIDVKNKQNNLIDLDDVFVFGGIGLMGYGLYLIYPPVCWITLGVIFMAIGWYRAGGK